MATYPSVTGRPNITTASGYAAWDAVGAPFQLPSANGGLNGQINILDLGTANAALLLHTYSQPPVSAAADGDPWTLHLADFPYYMGAFSVSATDWVTAGTARNRAMISTQHLAFQGGNSGRSMWIQLQCPATPTFNTTANPLVFNSVNLWD